MRKQIRIRNATIEERDGVPLRYRTLDDCGT